jgi:hypothetical protein
LIAATLAAKRTIAEVETTMTASQLLLRALSACLLLALALASVLVERHQGSSRATPEGVFRVYLAPTGSDANSGLTPDNPVRTLARAEAILRAKAPATNVEVRIARGTYVAPPTTWKFLVPGHTVTFLPADFELDQADAEVAGRPVFRGDGTSGFWFTARLPAGHLGGSGGLRFYYLRVERYDLGGLRINGGTVAVDGILRPATAGHNGNTIIGMYFTQLGSRWAPTRFGYGGVDLINSRDNLIEGNHFALLENASPRRSLMHGVYLAHHSTTNTVSHNRFDTVSGDPIRTRNESNSNDVFGNVFHRSGTTAQFSDWFCDVGCAQDRDRARECASHGNLFRQNDSVSGYLEEAVPIWRVFPGDRYYAGGPGCGNEGQQRVSAWGNT